jgi:DNA invertase Pin-like site-specific DNA recombinase
MSRKMMEKIANTCIYERGNTRKKIAKQRRPLTECARSHGWKEFREYADIQAAGVKPRRPDLDQLLADAKQRLRDAIVTLSPSRLSNSLGCTGNVLRLFSFQRDKLLSIWAILDTLAQLKMTPHGVPRDAIRRKLKASTKRRKKAGGH